jgi:hypothetical protein
MTFTISNLQSGVNLFGGNSGPDDPIEAYALQRLAQGVIIQASRDARAGDQEAAEWLVSLETGDTWLTLAGLNKRAVEEWVYGGCKRISNRKTRKNVLQRSNLEN